VEVIVERPAALDVHQAQVTACVRFPGPDGKRAQQVAQFSATVRGLLALRDWRAAHRVTRVAMEATGGHDVVGEPLAVRRRIGLAGQLVMLAQLRKGAKRARVTADARPPAM
jgi:hypothetical protein